MPVEVFTVNYDLLVERALDQFKVPYFDGFVGTIRASFQTEMAEALNPSDRDWLPSYFVRLWKLHGSVNWEWDKKNVVRLGRPVDSGVPAAIYPSDTKYDESRRVPFLVLQDRLRRSLHLPETILLVSGYSFGDDHLNELIFDAATRRERSEVIVFCRSKIPPTLASKAETTPNIQVVCAKNAIIGGVKGEWLAPSDPAPGIWADEQFALREFSELAAFLARSAPGDTSTEKLLQDAFKALIVQATPGAGASNARA